MKSSSAERQKKDELEERSDNSNLLQTLCSSAPLVTETATQGLAYIVTADTAPSRIIAGLLGDFLDLTEPMAQSEMVFRD